MFHEMARITDLLNQIQSNSMTQTSKRFSAKKSWDCILRTRLCTVYCMHINNWLRQIETNLQKAEPICQIMQKVTRVIQIFILIRNNMQQFILTSCSSIWSYFVQCPISCYTFISAYKHHYICTNVAFWSCIFSS
jgi:hypothetical protein